jgi:type IV pilus assembly protein PilC
MNRRSALSPKPTIYQCRWQGVDANGKRKTGRTVALSEQHAMTLLSQQKLIITRLSSRPLTRIEHFEQRVTPLECQLLLRQFAIMLTAGLSLFAIIELVSSQVKKAGMMQLLDTLRQEIANGSNMADALSHSHRFFQGSIAQLIKAGENTGQLAQSFTRITQHIDKQQQLRSKVKKAMIYPSAVLLVSLGLAYLMLTQIIPKFEAMFANLGAELPWFTQSILTLSQHLQHQGLMIGVGVILLALGFRYLAIHSIPFQRAISYGKPHLPIIGSLVKKATMARFCQTLAASYQCGIPILTAIDSAAQTTNDHRFIDAIAPVSLQLSMGTPLYLALRHTGLFPEFTIQLIMIGEESGTLEQALEHASLLFEQEVDNSVDNLEKLIEPLVIVALGGIVGSLVVAMYLPIFNLMNVLG